MQFDKQRALEMLREIGEFDWVQTGDLVTFAHDLGASSTVEVRDVALEIARTAVNLGIATLGTIKNRQFVPDPRTPDEVLHEARERWPLDRILEPGELFWLDLVA